MTINENSTEVVSGIIPVRDLSKLLGLSYSRIQALLTELDIERFKGTSGVAKYIAQEDFKMLEDYIKHTKNGGTLLEFKSTYVRELPTRLEVSDSRDLVLTTSSQEIPQDNQMVSLALATALENAVRSALPQRPVLSLKDRLELLLLAAQEQIPLPNKDLAEALALSPNTLRGKGETFALYGFTFTKEKSGREITWQVSRLQ